ncbi:MAG: hypothetical protein ACLU4N_07385 [Butyricimonas faecihominis]
MTDNIFPVKKPLGDGRCNVAIPMIFYPCQQFESLTLPIILLVETDVVSRYLSAVRISDVHDRYRVDGIGSTI